MTSAARLASDIVSSKPSEWWADTSVVLPPTTVSSTISAAITGEEAQVTDGTIRVAAVLSKLPAAVLTNYVERAGLIGEFVA